MIWILLFFPVVYFLFLLYIFLGWFKIWPAKASHQPLPIKVSILIAARNEDKNLGPLLLDLKKQQYAVQDFEIILVDDHSEKRISEAFCAEINDLGNIRVIDLPKNKCGKKEALSLAASLSMGELFLFTDADCRIQPTWIQSYVNAYEREKPDLIAGLVDYMPTAGILDIFSRLEIVALQVSGLAAIGRNMPVMCNGANMAVKGEAYKNCISEINLLTPSGDDIFLLHALKKRGAKIIALKNKSALVYTSAPGNLKSSFAQHLRWASKGKYYSDSHTLVMGTIVFGANLSLAVSAIVGLFWLRADIFLWTFAVKIIADCLLIAAGYSYFRFGRKQLVWLPLFEILYSFFTVITVISSTFLPFRWKGRKL